MRFAALVLVAAVLAGCASAPQDASEARSDAAPVPTLPPTGLAPNASVEVPVWDAGQAWVVETHDGAQDAEALLVVVSAGADGYVIATTDERLATWDAALDVSYVGKIRASDLAGAQQDQPVKFFDFPLSDGKAWSATWDRLQINLTATFSPKISTPLGAQPGFVIVGTGPGGAPYVSYDFVPALGWWSHLDFAAGYGFAVKAVKRDWKGEYLTGASKTLLALATAAPVAPTPAGAFTVDKDQTTLLLTIAGGSTRAYARTLALVDPDHQVYNSGDVENYEMGVGPGGTFKTAFLPATAGEWHVGAPTLHDPDGSFRLAVQQIALAKRTL